MFSRLCHLQNEENTVLGIRACALKVRMHQPVEDIAHPPATVFARPCRLSLVHRWTLEAQRRRSLTFQSRIMPVATQTLAFRGVEPAVVFPPAQKGKPARMCTQERITHSYFQKTRRWKSCIYTGLCRAAAVTPYVELQ